MSIITKNFYELPDFLQFLWNILKKLNPLTTLQESEKQKNKNIFSLIVETIASIGNSILNNYDP